MTLPKISLGTNEPALLLDALKTALVMLATFLPQLHLSDEVQTWVLAVGVAVFGLLKGMSTHPFPVTAITDLIVAVGILAIGLGLNVTQDQLGTIVVFVTAVMVAIQRHQISPVGTAAPVA